MKSPIASISYFILAISCLIYSWPIYALGELIERTRNTELMVQKTASHRPDSQNIEVSKKAGKTEPSNIYNKYFFVKNYYPGLPVQAVGLQVICKENREVFFKLDLYRYSNTDVTAVNVGFEFTTIFDDILAVSDVSCLDLDSDGMVLHTKEQHLLLDFDKIKSLKSVRVIIKKYISNNSTVTCITESKEIALSDTELSALKYLAGINAVSQCVDTASGWMCVCGTENNQDITECKLCGKSRQNMDSGVGDLNILIDKLASLNSTREMKAYLVEYNANCNNERLSHLIAEVDKLAQLERMYGNMKQEALKMIKKELDVNHFAEKSKVIEETTEKEFCYKCGASTVPNTKFCQRCGTPKVQE